MTEDKRIIKKDIPEPLKKFEGSKIPWSKKSNPQDSNMMGV